MIFLKNLLSINLILFKLTEKKDFLFLSFFFYKGSSIKIKGRKTHWD